MTVEDVFTELIHRVTGTLLPAYIGLVTVGVMVVVGLNFIRNAARNQW